MANALRKERYTPTVWQKEFAMLNVKENGAYTMGGLPDGCQMVAIDKNREDKISIDKSSSSNINININNKQVKE